MKNLSTNADSSTNNKKILPVRQNLPSIFFAQGFYTLYEQTFPNLRPPISITFPQGFRKFIKLRTFKRSEQMKKIFKNFFCRDNFTPIMSISF